MNMKRLLPELTETERGRAECEKEQFNKEKVLEIIEKRILSENLVEHPQLNYDDNTQKTMKKVILIHNNALQELKSEISKLKGEVR